MNQKERGNSTVIYDSKNSLAIIRWKDNAIVTVVSNLAATEPLQLNWQTNTRFVISTKFCIRIWTYFLKRKFWQKWVNEWFFHDEVLQACSSRVWSLLFCFLQTRIAFGDSSPCQYLMPNFFRFLCVVHTATPNFLADFCWEMLVRFSNIFSKPP